MQNYKNNSRTHLKTKKKIYKNQQCFSQQDFFQFSVEDCSFRFKIIKFPMINFVEWLKCDKFTFNFQFIFNSTIYEHFYITQKCYFAMCVCVCAFLPDIFKSNKFLLTFP